MDQCPFFVKLVVKIMHWKACFMLFDCLIFTNTQKSEIFLKKPVDKMKGMCYNNQALNERAQNEANKASV